MNRSTQRSLCAAMLVLQAIVLFLAGVLLIGLSSLSAPTALGVGVGLAVLCLVAAGLLRSPVGYWLGWLVQVVSLALGFVTLAMVFLGVVFGALWATAYFLGIRIDREKAEREVLEQQWRAEHGSEA